MWPTQPSATVERMNPGFLAPCPPNPQLYPSHKTTLLSRRRGVLPQPAPATAISGSPFLFLPTVEFLISDSSHESSDKNTLPWQSFPTPLFAVSQDRCLFVHTPCCMAYTPRS